MATWGPLAPQLAKSAGKLQLRDKEALAAAQRRVTAAEAVPGSGGPQLCKDTCFQRLDVAIRAEAAKEAAEPGPSPLRTAAAGASSNSPSGALMQPTPCCHSSSDQSSPLVRIALRVLCLGSSREAHALADGLRPPTAHARSCLFPRCSGQAHGPPSCPPRDTRQQQQQQQQQDAEASTAAASRQRLSISQAQSPQEQQPDPERQPCCCRLGTLITLRPGTRLLDEARFKARRIEVAGPTHCGAIPFCYRWHEQP